MSIILTFLVLIIIPFFRDYNYLAKVENVSSLTQMLELRVPELLNKYNIPGAAVSVIDEGNVTWVKTFGYADIENSIEVERDTVFQVASISKPVTAIGIIKLADNGVISLDDPAEKYITRWTIPESIHDKEEVTIRRILNHTSGLSIGGGYPGYNPNTQLPTIEESLTGIKDSSQPVELAHEPGIKFTYSGGGYSLLQLLIEEATGMNYSQFMKSYVLEPLDMKRSSFLWEGDLKNKTAKAYDKNLKNIPNYLFVEKAAAGLYTTIDDINKLVLEEINSYKGNGILLSKDMVNEMYNPAFKLSRLESYLSPQPALGHFVNYPDDLNFLVTHYGANKGWKSNFTIVPNKEAGIVILTNGDNGTYLLDEVLNSWHFTALGRKSSLDKLKHIISSISYSIALVLLFWSLIIVYSLIIQIYKGIRVVTNINNKLLFTTKCFCILLLGITTYLLQVAIGSVLQIINPNSISIITIALVTRAITAIGQVIFPKVNFAKA